MNEARQKLNEEIKQKLLSIDRKGMSELVAHMVENGFFKAPASTRYHGDYQGGLNDHCYSLYDLFSNMLLTFGLHVSENSRLICAFGHDLCKMGAYIPTNYEDYTWNKEHPKGHSELSIAILKRFIELKPEEEEIIRYHMGMYGTKEFSSFMGEYNIKDLGDIYNKNKIAKLFYFCDDMSSNFLEEKK